MENNNNRNNGRGIFYGVIGVATLVVAIIGATFAYFSAEITGANNMLTGSTEISLAYEVVTTEGLKDDLIPIELDGKGAVKRAANGIDYAYATGKDEDDDYDKFDFETLDTTTFPVQYGENGKNFKALPGVTEESCRDKNGNSICSVFTFRILNPSTTIAQTVYGSITVTENTFKNLHYAVFVGNHEDLEGNYHMLSDDDAVLGLAQSAVASDEKSFGGKLIERGQPVPKTGLRTRWENSAVLLYPKDNTDGKISFVEYTILLWLEETGAEQDEQGKTFNASITFDTGNGKGVTGQLSTVS